MIYGNDETVNTECQVMKKLFLAVCFNLLLINTLSARVTPVTGYTNLQLQSPEQNTEPVVHRVDFGTFKKLVRDGFSNAVEADPKTINQNIGYWPSEAQKQAEQEKNKSLFQKMYEQALDRIAVPTDKSQRQDVVSENDAPDISAQQQTWQQSSALPTITAYLPPDNQPTAVPALEHIPYLMNSIEVLPSGLVKFEETIVVVADGNKLSRGLTKILPQTVYNSEGSAQSLDYSVIGVRVNDMPVDYHLTSDGENALLVPEEDYRLSPGIYTYKFEYLVDNLLWDYGSYYQLYWDVGGGGWNLVVDRLGASLNLPRPNAVLDQSVLLGSTRRLDANAVSIRPNGSTAIAWIAARPLFVGEGMYLVVNIDKAALDAPTLWQKIVRSFYNYGDIYFSFVGTVVIAISFLLSWRYIVKDKGQLKFKFERTAIMSRFLLFNRFDLKSVCGFLLELYRKNIIDIQQAGETVLLIKRTDNPKNLAKWQQKALRLLFPKHETVFNVNPNNKLPFKRFAGYLEQNMLRQLWRFRFKLNIGYLLSGMGLIALVEAFIAAFKLDSLYVFGVLSATSVVCMSAILLWSLTGRRWLKIFLRLISLDITALCFVVFSAMIHPLASLLLIISLLIIAGALNVYSGRLGLIKHYIQDIGRFRDYLLANRDNLVLSKNIVNYQALIWALDAEDKFDGAVSAEAYKIPVMQTIVRLWH